MTTPASGSGRPSALRRPLSGLLALLLLASAVPAVQAADSAEGAAHADTALIAPRGEKARPARDFTSLLAFEAVASAYAPSSEPQSGGRLRTLINKGLALLGTPYRWGGTSPDSGFDCSGFVGYVFSSTLGIQLPRISRDMATTGEPVARQDLREGDLVFFSRSGKRIDHVGIYIGNGQFVHSPRTGKSVEVVTMDSGYWSNRFMHARRVATQ